MDSLTAMTYLDLLMYNQQDRSLQGMEQKMVQTTSEMSALNDLSGQLRDIKDQLGDKGKGTVPDEFITYCNQYGIDVPDDIKNGKEVGSSTVQTLLDNIGGKLESLGNESKMDSIKYQQISGMMDTIMTRITSMVAEINRLRSKIAENT
jgi:hypothetical protein